MKHLGMLPIFIVMTACGGPLKYQVASSPAAPGADARLVADISEEQNQTKLNVEVVSLAPPNRVSEDAKSYVVWYRGNESKSWNRVGALRYDEDDRTGEFEGTVPATAFDFEISAEPDVDGASPSAVVVFSQRVED
ncbi:MAG: hypothetical protein QM784_01100 [Polyangiaceae bacterium]